MGMEMKEICPCVVLDCPNFGDCAKCTSRHLKKGSLNYCAFYSILPELREAIAASPESETARKLAAMTEGRLALYDKLALKQGLPAERQERRLKAVTDYSDY